MCRGSTPRHAQTAGDLGFAVQFNAETPRHFAVQFNVETPWHFTQLRYPRSDSL